MPPLVMSAPTKTTGPETVCALGPLVGPPQPLAALSSLATMALAWATMSPDPAAVAAVVGVAAAVVGAVVGVELLQAAAISAVAETTASSFLVRPKPMMLSLLA